MSRVLFIGDLHLGHKSICGFSGELRGGCTTVEEHDQWIKEQWNSVVEKRDLVWVLGDVAFDKEALKVLKQMKGNKHLILGNHDKFSWELYKEYFNKIHGFWKHKGNWLSHAPIYMGELRGRHNIHGHVHANSIPDSRYINVSVEAINGQPKTLDQLLKEERDNVSRSN